MVFDFNFPRKSTTKMLVLYLDDNIHFLKQIYLFIYFWLCWVFIAVCRLSIDAASGGYSSLW